MMVEFKWISLFLTAVLQFTAAAGKLPLSFTVRVGGDVTLPCENVIDGQQKCENTTWLFSDSGNTATVELVKLGKTGESAKSKSDRLSVTENCSLVIKKVTVEDVGRWYCQQYTSGGKRDPDSEVHLSVITMTKRKYTDKVTLNCSVLTYGQFCIHTVKWLYEGKDVDKDNKDMKTSQSGCNATVSFLDFHFSNKSKSNLKCEVTDGYSGKVQLFPFSPQSSATTTTKPTTTKPATTTTKPATTTTTTTKPTTTKPATTKPATSKPTTTTKPATPKPATTTTTEPATTKPATTTTTTKPATTTENTKSQGWLWFVAVAALLITVVIVVGFIRWKKTKGKKTQMDENTGRSLNPAVSPESSQDTADPEDGVSYASISYTRKTNGKGRVLGKDGDDEDDAVTYSSVKASSSSAGASADPSDLYATVN